MWPTIITLCLALSTLAPRKAARRRRPAFRRPLLERLEERTVPSVFTVRNTNDSGPDSLRQAIVDANAAATGTAASPDLIDFCIPGSGMQTILLQSQLPKILYPVVIDGTTAAGWTANTSGTCYNAKLTIALDGTDAGASEALLIAGGYSTVKGLQIQNFPMGGVHLLTNGYDTILGNSIQNSGGDEYDSANDPLVGGGGGVYIDGVAGNIVGGTSLDARNEFANDFLGVHIAGAGASSNQVLGNAIGNDGTMDLNNSVSAYSEVMVTNASDNTIGGLTSAPGTGPGNVIGGADGLNSIQIWGSSRGDASGNVIQGNLINLTNPDSPSDNETSAYAIGLDFNVTNTLIGGSSASARNVISGGDDGGIGIAATFSGPGDPPQAVTGTVIQENYIGVDATGATGFAQETGGQGIQDSGIASVIENNVVSGWRGGNIVGGSGSIISGNKIGTDWTGTQPILNNGAGLLLGDHEQITGNVIAFNSGPGVTSVFGGGTQNTIEGNSIHDNTGLGIDLTGSGIPLLNDSQGHVGTNNFQDFPTLMSATSSATSTFIMGTFCEAAEPNTTLTLDFYANPTEDHSDYGQGATYLGSRTIYTDARGYAAFDADLAVGDLAGQWISATATDEANATLGTTGGNTSEFSKDFQATASSQTFTQNLPGSLPQSATGSNALTIEANPSTISDVVTALAPANLGSPVTAVSVYLNLAPGSYTHQTVSIPPGMTLFINGVPGTTIDPASPAFTLAAGNVIASGITFVTTGDAATILVTGGSLTLRNCVVQESTGFSDAAIAVTAGTVDMGTAASPGGNTININGAGVFASNTTSSPIAAVGDTFTVNGQPLTPSSLSGLVWEDFNDDGQVDFGENGLSGVTVTLTGTDFLGNAVKQSQPTDGDGAYVFLNLLPGNYYITETPPSGYTQGIDSVGTAGGSVSAADQFFVALGAGVNGLNYNFGEQPPAGGGVHHGQTATIGFWNNKNGQALIKALNGGGADGFGSHQLGDWLAATLPNTFGSLAGKSNAYVAALFQQDFVMKGVKLDAQLLATALSVYATSATLDPTQAAASYGFTVSANGAGTATASVGSNGDAFGVANTTTMTLMDLLLAADAQAVNGVLYSGNTTKRNEANSVFSAVNQDGDLS